MTKMRSYFLVILTVFLLAIGSSTTAVAAATTADQPALNYNVYLKLDGICGESNADKFANWIVLTGVDFGVSNSASAPALGGGGAAGKAVMDHFTVTKTYDCSSVSLLTSSLSGKHIKNAQIAFVKPGTDLVFLTINLTDVTIAEYQFNNTYETIALNFSSIETSYTQQDEKGGNKLPVKGGWDFSKNIMK
jgi:type VI protein secretion system component Hcp